MSSPNVVSKEQESKSGLLERFLDIKKPYDIEGIPLKLYVLVAVLSIAILQLDLLTQSGVAGAYAVLWTIALFFYAIGERVRILKALVGGGLVVAWAGAAMISRVGLIGQEEIQFIQAQVIGNGFLYVVWFPAVFLVWKQGSLRNHFYLMLLLLLVD
jgi:Na+/citrate or Na+/malate symporter